MVGQRKRSKPKTPAKGAVMQPHYRMRVVQDKTKYNRKGRLAKFELIVPSKVFP